MNNWLEIILAFAGTNIDNFVFIALMLTAANCKAERYNVILTQYLGLAILVLVSMLGGSVVSGLLMEQVHLLGVIPLLIGLHGLLRLAVEDNRADRQSSFPTFSALLLANLSGGMDNISVYVPLFARNIGWGWLARMGIGFTLMLAVWCLAAGAVAALPAVRIQVQQRVRILIPIVFLLLGLYIIFC